MTANDTPRIRFVTRRFAELNGLRQLVVVPACLLSFWAPPYVEHLGYAGPTGVFLGLLAAIGPFVIVVVSRPLLDRYYRERFGSVATDFRQRFLDLAPGAFLLVAAVWIDMATLKTTAPSAVLVVGAILATQVTVRDWPWRAHYLFTAIICGAGAWMTAGVPAMSIDNLQDLLRISLSILLLAHVVPAWLDHRLLVRALPQNPEASEAAADVLEIPDRDQRRAGCETDSIH